MRPLPDSPGFKKNSEIDKIQWLSRRETHQILDYENDRGLLHDADLKRLSQTGTLHLLRHATAVGLPSLEREAAAAGVMMLPIPRAGVLKGVEGIADAEAVPLIESVTMSMHMGSKLVPLPEGGDYLGFIFARGATCCASRAWIPASASTT